MLSQLHVTSFREFDLNGQSTSLQWLLTVVLNDNSEVIQGSCITHGNFSYGEECQGLVMQTGCQVHEFRHSSPSKATDTSLL